MGKGEDPWLESLDEFKLLKNYERQKERAKSDLVKAERTVRGDWKPRQKVTNSLNSSVLKTYLGPG